ncbi:tetratricopeptide repeat protein [Solidesulfovibrio magneticus]|nr:tetratricopeptide repeat protein [Solidesulfovibrio magneticus]
MIKQPNRRHGKLHLQIFTPNKIFLLFLLIGAIISVPPARASGQETLTNLIHKAADNWQQRDFDEMLQFVKIDGGKDTEEFLRVLDTSIQSINTFNGVSATQQARDAFRARILEELDARRFAQVDDILREATTRFPNLEAAVRTGSSGLRHLGKDSEGGYRPLLSDDDITFVGEGAQEAKTWFNQQVKNRGLAGVKVKGFTLNDPGRFSRQERAILDLLDPEKFVGQSAMSGIRGETLKKGAVVLAKGPEGKLVFTRVSLADHLSSLNATRSALDSFVENAARRYGPLTMTASVERQIVNAHNGWDNLTSAEKVKYMQRSRRKLNESRGLTSDPATRRLEEMASRFSKFPPPNLTAEDAVFLATLRRENILEGFKAANNRLFIQSVAARQAGGNLATNAQVREAIDELATGFAMLKELGGKPEFGDMVDVDAVVDELIRNADGNPELKKMLYTASKQADDMLDVLRQWSGMENEFAAMLARLPAMTPYQRGKALAEYKQMLEAGGGPGMSAQAGKNELAMVEELSKASATKEGDALIVAMIKSPAGKKVLVGLALSGGAVAFSKMQERWKDGGWYNDLSSAASTLVEFLPGAMSFDRLQKDGYISPGLAYEFVKEAMYLTPLWPAALSADLATIAYDVARAVTLENYQDGLVDILETNGVFEDGRFTALRLPDGETIPRDRLAAFLKEDRTVKLANANRPDLLYTTNLSEKAADVYASRYVKSDPVLQDLQKALIQQIGHINLGQTMGQISDQEWLEAAKSGFKMLFAVENVCTKTPKQWCELVTIYQNKIKERADDIFPNVMVPHLVSLAEDAHKALTGNDEAIKAIMETQRELEALRGSPLTVDLAQEAAQQAAKAGDLRATSLSGDTATKRDKALAEGGYLQAAAKAYGVILKEAKDSLQDIVDRTGYKETKVLTFPFSGNFFQDAAKARQSRRGFMFATNAILQDVAKIKGAAPDVLDETDLKALEILAEVAYRNRTALDQANSAKVDVPEAPASAPIPDLQPPMVGKESPYHAWYKDAMEKVKALYAKAADLKKLVSKGVLLVAPGKEMIERVPGVFEARIADASLRAMLNEGKALVEWSSDQFGAAFSDKTSLKTSFTPDEPGQATVRATFSLKAEPAAEASVQAKITVRPAETPSVSLTAHPSEAQPKGTVTASALPDSMSARRPLGYEWSCDNCQVLEKRGSQALIGAPSTGEATVQVRMTAEDGKELAAAVTRFTVAAPSDKSNDPQKPEKEPGGVPEKQDKNAAQAAPDQASKEDKTPRDQKLGPDVQTTPPVAPSPVAVPSALITPAPTTPPTSSPGQGSPSQPAGQSSQAAAQGQSQKPDQSPPPQQPNEPAAEKAPASTATDPAWTADTWNAALTLKWTSELQLAKPGVSGTARQTYEERKQYAEKMLTVFWQREKEHLAGLPAVLRQWRQEADGIFNGQIDSEAKDAEKKWQEVKQKLGLGKSGQGSRMEDAFGDSGNKASYSSTLPDLEGEMPKSKRITASEDFGPDMDCAQRIRNQRSDYLGRLDRKITEADALVDAFSRQPTDNKIYEDTMRRAEQFWEGPGGMPPSNWREAGIKETLTPPCGKAPARSLSVAASGGGKASSLRVTLKADGQSAAAGSPMKVTAEASGGKSPYRFLFLDAQSSKDNVAVYALPAGKWELFASVQVIDAENQTASAELRLEMAPIKLELHKKSPSGNSLAVGEQAAFEARLTSQGKPVEAGQYVIRWEPSTEARFSKSEGLGALANTATFARPGKVKVWAVALQKAGSVLTTAAESNQIELDVAGASMSLSASPAEPLVGQEVTVTAVESPKLADADATYWWHDSQGGAGTGPTANQRLWRFTVKEAKPVTVNAVLKGKKGGEELAKASLTITPKIYEVSAVSLGHAWGGETTRPVIWKPEGGFVTLDKEIAAHMDVGLRADISPAPPQGQTLRYAWSVNEGSSLTGGPASQETRAQRASTGTIEAKVEVRDGNNVLLGAGSVSVPVTVSDEDVKQGKSKSQELEKLKQDAATAWNAGEIDLACEKGTAAVRIDPKFPDAKTYCESRERILNLAKQGEGELAQDALERAQAKLDEAKRINAKAKILAGLEEKIKRAREATSKAEKLLAQAAKQWAEGDAEGAERAASEALALAPKLDRAKSDKQRYTEGLAKLKASLEHAKDLQSKNEIAPALTAVANGKGVNPAYKPLLDLEKQLLEQQKKQQELAKLLEKSQKQWEDGEVDEACLTAQEAAKLDVPGSEAKSAASLYCQGRDAVAQAVKHGESELTASQLDKAQVQLEAGRKINAKAKSLAELEEKINKTKERQKQVEQLLARAAKEWSDGEADKAAATVEEALKIDPKNDKALEEKKSFSGKLEKLRFTVGEAKKALTAKDAAKGMAAVAEGKAVNARYKPLLDLEAELGKLSRENAQNEAERKRRTDLIVAGAGECTKENWQACKDKIASSIDGSDKIFGPQDSEMVAKAKALLAKAEQNLANKKQAEAQNEAERKRRTDLIVAGAGECTKENWQACKDKIASSIDGSDKIFGPQDSEMVAKAKALLAKAEQNLANKKQAEAQNEAERKRRTDLIVAGAGECTKENWQACKDKIASSIDGSDKIFGPQDSEMVAKAKALLAKAEQNLANKKQAEAQNEAERKRRTDLIVAGAGECTKENWQACKDKLTAALEGAEKIFGQQDAALTTKAKALKAKAQEQLDAGKRQAEAEAKRNMEQDNAKKQAEQQQNKCNTMFKQADAKYESKDYQGSIAIYRKLLELCPDNCNAMNNLGLSIEASGNKQESLKWYEKAAKCDPSQSLYAENVEQIQKQLAESNKEKQCNDLFEKALGKDKTGDRSGAIADYKVVLAYCPDYCGAMNNIGILLDASNNKKDALLWFEKAVKCNPSAERYKKNATLTREEIAQQEQTTSNKASCDKLWDQAQAKGKDDNHRGAIEDYRKVLSMCPNNCSAMNNIGAQLDKLGEKQNALAWFEKAAKCDPDKELYKENVRTTRQEISENRHEEPQQSASRQNTSQPSSPQSTTASMDGTYSGTFSSPVFKGKVKVQVEGTKVTGVATDSSGAQVDFEGTLKRQTGEISCFLVYRGKSSGGQGNAKGHVQNGSIEGTWAFFTLEAKPTEYKGTWTASK